MSSIFSLQNIGCGNKLNTTNILERSLTNETYFISTVEFLQEHRQEFRGANKELYRAMLECEHHEILHESFSSFISKVKEIIDKFVKFIKSLFDRFLLHIASLVKSDKYIEKNKDRLKKFSSEHEFEYEGYMYTFTDTIPVCDALATFEEGFIGLSFTTDTNDSDLIDHIKTLHAALTGDLNNDFYNSHRAKVLGREQDVIIYKEDFADELFKIFRDGSDSKEKFTVTFSHVMDAITFYERHDKVKKSIEKTKSTLEKDYKAVEKKLNAFIAKSEKDGSNFDITTHSDYGTKGSRTAKLTPESRTKLDMYIKALVNQVIEMSTTHSLAFAAKLDAITECYAQDKDILYKVFSKLAKDKDLRGIE